jgi:hypothetical protein
VAGENQPKHSDHVCQLAIRLFGQDFFFFSQPANVSIPNFQRCHPFKKKKKTQTVPRDLPMESRRPVSLSFFFFFFLPAAAAQQPKEKGP